MGSTAATLPPPSTSLMLMEGRALPELGAFWLMRPWLSLTARGDGHAVMVLPGLLADDAAPAPAGLPKRARLPGARLEAGAQLRAQGQPGERDASAP